MAYTLTADQLKVVRSWVGNHESEDSLNERYDRLEGDIDETILESLRARLAVLQLDRPAQISVDGVSTSWGDNIRALEKRIKDFIAQGGTDGDPEDSVAAFKSIPMKRYHRAR